MADSSLRHVFVEIKAGKMATEGKKVIPDKRKGKLVVFRDVDGLMHLCWEDRDTNSIEDDWVVFPGGATFEQLPNQRVVRFEVAGTNNFFWLQEPNKELDAQFVQQVNDAINTEFDPSAVDGLDPSQVAALLSGGNLPMNTTAPPSMPQSVASPSVPASQSNNPVQLAQLQQLLQSLTGIQAPAQGDLYHQQQQAAGPVVPLRFILTTERMQKLIQDPSVHRDLMQHLPDSHQNMEGLREAIASPQMFQALDQLTQAIYSDQLPILMSSLGFDPNAAFSSADPMTAFINALQNAARQQNS